VTRTIEGVSAVANDTGTQAEAVLAAAEALSGDADLLDQEVTGFLNQVRGNGTHGGH
jgi:methyl-accepting chemotaxis protein